jgi:formylglycine-generating enzyme required for sulfatase activity
MVIKVTAQDLTSAEYSIALSSPAKIITATTLGTLVGGNITTVPAATKVSAFKSGLTVSANATVEILVGAGGAAVADQTTTDVTAAMVIKVTAQDLTSAEYTIALAGYISPNIGNLKYVPAGTFQRDATPENTSSVSTFWMSQHEITRTQFNTIMLTDPSNVTYSSGVTDPVQMTNWYHAIAFCNKLSSAEGLTPAYAVTGVDFSTLNYAAIPTGDDADWNTATCNWAANGYRLPTEMEWMWAAMDADTGNPGATNTTGYLKAFAGSTGDNLIGDYAWHSGNSSFKTHPAGVGKTANELGLFDMSGNVTEWCWDWEAGYPAGPQSDYHNDAGSFRVLRGGGCGDETYALTVKYRNYTLPYYQAMDLGFRVVRP